MQSLSLKWVLALWLGFSTSLGFLIFSIGYGSFTLLSSRQSLMEGLRNFFGSSVASILTTLCVSFLVLFIIFLIGFLLGARLHRWVLKWIKLSRIRCFFMGIFIGLMVTFLVNLVIDVALSLFVLFTCHESFGVCFGGPFEMLGMFLISLLIAFSTGGWVALICGVLATFGFRKFLKHSLIE